MGAERLHQARAILSRFLDREVRQDEDGRRVRSAVLRLVEAAGAGPHDRLRSVPDRTWLLIALEFMVASGDVAAEQELRWLSEIAGTPL